MPETTADFTWPEGKRAALSITFDDARYSQLDLGLPILDAHGIRATFYANPHGARSRVDDWRKALAAGHEIGNHTLTHPCSGNSGTFRRNALEEYTLDRLEQDIAGANAALEELFGRTPSTFAYPCGHKFVGRGENVQSYVPLVARHFIAGRGYRDDTANDPAYCDLAQLHGRDADSWPVSAIKEWIDDAVRHNHWLILVAHHIGANNAYSIAPAVLEETCAYAGDPQLGIWTDTVAAIAGRIAQSRGVSESRA